jgi:hypothetical protein
MMASRRYVVLLVIVSDWPEFALTPAGRGGIRSSHHYGTQTAPISHTAGHTRDLTGRNTFTA